MANSMTGFGLGEYKDDNYYVTVEIKAVNQKFLDINCRFPRKLSFLEDRVRGLVKNILSRGHVEIFVKFETRCSSGVELIYDINLAKQYYDVLCKIKEEFSLNTQITHSEIVNFPDVVTTLEAKEDEDVLWNCLKVAVEKALNQLVSMREIEGKQLVSDILMRTNLLETMINDVEKYSDRIVDEYKDKLYARIKDIMNNVDVDEVRLAQEVAIYADKANVTEEIVRFRSHIEQLRNTVNLDIPIGRKLDFIIQEMNRETNTIGSKSSKVEITNLVIDMKSEIEKIREQIQNIE